MKVIVKDEKCIGCGSCVSLTDRKIFDFDEETGKACTMIDKIEKEDMDVVQSAIEFCPTDAIEAIEE